ncbi:MAG: hypothetical protein ABIJ74_00515 [archaeon]
MLLLVVVFLFLGCTEQLNQNNQAFEEKNGEEKENGETDVQGKVNQNLLQEKAVKLADEFPEVKLTSKIVESFDSVENCTLGSVPIGSQKTSLITNYKRLEGKEFKEFSELNIEEIRKLEEAIKSTKERANCNLTLSKEVEKESENVYFVSYKIEMNDSCGNTSQVIKLKVNLENETVVIEKGIETPEETKKQYEQYFNVMEDCAAVMIYSSSVIDSVISQASNRIQTDKDLCDEVEFPGIKMWYDKDQENEYYLGLKLFNHEWTGFNGYVRDLEGFKSDDLQKKLMYVCRKDSAPEENKNYIYCDPVYLSKQPDKHLEIETVWNVSYAQFVEYDDSMYNTPFFSDNIKEVLDAELVEMRCTK